MQKKRYCLLTLVVALTLGTVMAALPPLKASPGPVTFYIVDAPMWGGDGDNIIAGKSPGTSFPVQAWIDSPTEWTGTSDGIVGFQVSVLVDPRVLTITNIGKVPDLNWDGIGEGLLAQFAWFGIGSVGTMEYPEVVEAANGQAFGWSESIINWPDYGVGAGGTGQLCWFFFVSNSLTDPSPIAFSSWWIRGLDVRCQYTNAKGETYDADVETGYYNAECLDLSFFDLTSPASVVGTLWHELWPVHCQEWRIDSEEDEDEILEPSDQIDITLLPDETYKAWYHVEWVNPDPVAGDGIVDLIVKFKIEIPEFPLGIGILMMLAPLIPIVYLWRRKELEK